jgi:hypothetical protein
MLFIVGTRKRNWPVSTLTKVFLNNFFVNSFPFLFLYSCQLMIIVMRWYRELCTDFLAFPYSGRKPRNISALRRAMRTVRQVIASNGVSYFQMRLIGSHSTSGREHEGINGRIGSRPSMVRCDTFKKVKSKIKSSLSDHSIDNITRDDIFFRKISAVNGYIHIWDHSTLKDK